LELGFLSFTLERLRGEDEKMDYFSINVSKRGLFTASHEPGKINVLLAVFLGGVDHSGVPFALASEAVMPGRRQALPE
jgi:hypothetical protein